MIIENPTKTDVERILKKAVENKICDIISNIFFNDIEIEFYDFDTRSYLYEDVMGYMSLKYELVIYSDKYCNYCSYVDLEKLKKIEDKNL